MSQTPGIHAYEKPVENDFEYVYSENKNKGFIKVTKAMMKVLLGVSTKLSELENDKEFIDKTVADLENYYSKTETYSKEEVNDKISLIPKFSVKVVYALPFDDISETTIYLVPASDGDENLYTEYINVNGLWEILGSQKITSLEIDNTLTKEGYAADAKVTGDKIGHLSDKINGGEIKGYNSHTYIPRTPKFENKYASFYGDSITLGSVLVDKYHSWPKLFWDKVYPEDPKSYNVAVGGSMYCSDGQHGSIINQIKNESAEFKNNSRTFFVAGGVNDWVLGTPLDNFRTAVQEVFDYIEANLTGEVIWITPIRYNQDESNWRECIAPLQKYREIIAEVVMSNITNATNTHYIIDGRDIGFPCYGSELTDLVFQDEAHPNQNGIDLIYVPGLVRIFNDYFVKKDYTFTEADRQAVVNDVLNALPTWTGGSY